MGSPREAARRFGLAAFFVVLATLAAFSPLPVNKFILIDDPEYITENANIRDGVTRAGVAWALTSVYRENWHPLTWVSHMADVQLFGLDPAGHHLTSLLLHLANALLLLLVLRRMTGALWRSALVALLFAVHPLHVESVAWASERKDLLCALFWLLSLLAYLRYTQKPGWKRYLPLLAAIALGLSAKQMLVTLPFALLLLDYWPLARGRRPLALVAEKIPLFLMSAGASLITFRAQTCGRQPSLELQALLNNAGNALQAYAGYLGKTLWPAKLAVLYLFDESKITAARTGGAALLLLAISLAALILIRRRPYLAVGWLWFLGTLVPVIGMVRFGYQSMADRYTYLPLIGVFAAVAWGLADLAAGSALARRTAAGASAAAVGVLALLTFGQVGRWHDTITLLEHTVAVTDDNWYAYNVLGAAYIMVGTNNRAVNIAASLPREPVSQQRSIAYLRRAVDACSTSLRLNPGDHFAAENLQLARRALYFAGDRPPDSSKSPFR